MILGQRGVLLGVAALLFLGGCTGSGSGPGSGVASAVGVSTLPIATPTGSASLGARSASPTGASVLGGDALPVSSGDYATRFFVPPFDFTIPTDLGIRNSGESSAFLYIGEDLVVETPSDEFDAAVFSQVFDPADQRSVHPAPPDMMPWFLQHQRLKRIDGPEVISVDGLPARRADLDVIGDQPCDFNFGRPCLALSPLENSEPFNVAGNRRIRVVVVDVKGGQVVFTYFERPDRFAANVGVFDSIVDSVHFR